MDHRISKYINRIYRTSLLDRQAQMEAFGLSGHAVSYLLAVHRHQAITQDRIVNQMYVNKSTVARQLAQLERDGFIRRTPSPDDRRKLVVRLTERGTEVIPHIRAFIDAWNDEMLDGLTDGERDELDRLLRLVARRATLRAERDGLTGGRSSASDDLKQTDAKTEASP